MPQNPIRTHRYSKPSPTEQINTAQSVRLAHTHTTYPSIITTLHYGYTCMPSSPFLSFFPSKIATRLRHSPIKTQPATQLIKDRKRRSTEEAQRNALAHTAGVLRMLDLVRKDHKTAQNPAIWPCHFWQFFQWPFISDLRDLWYWDFIFSFFFLFTYIAGCCNLVYILIHGMSGLSATQLLKNQDNEIYGWFIVS